MSILETERDRDNRLRSDQSAFSSHDTDDVVLTGTATPYRRVGSMVSNSPYFDGKDIAAAALATAMLLGPLFAAFVGWAG